MLPSPTLSFLLASTLAMAWGFAARPCAAATDELRVSGPIAHENIAVYFLHGPSAPGPVPLTLQEAMAKGSVLVHETGNVRALEIENTGNEEVFVQLGDIVKGGKQDRVLTVSLVLPPNSGRMPIGSYCVEQGRWSARGAEDTRKFSVSEALMPSRRAKLAMAKPASPRPVGVGVRPPAPEQTGSIARAPDAQQEVWSSVGQIQDQLSSAVAAPVASATSRSSLQLALENETLKKAQEARLAALEPAGLREHDIIGVVVAINGRLATADVYPSSALFKKMWPKLVRATITEALSEAHGKSDAPPTAEAALAFLRAAETGTASERDLTSTVKLESREAEGSVFVAAKRANGSFLHRSYVAK